MRSVLVALALVGCSKSPPPSSAPPEAGPLEASAPAVPVSALAPVDAAPPRKVSQASVARIAKDALNECVDMSTDLAADADAGKDPAAELVKDMAKKDKTLTLIPKACGEQFADRTALATCTMKQVGKNGTITVASHRYSFADVGLSDAAMKECLDMKGDWNAVPRDSAEFRKAKIEHARRGLQRTVDKLDQDEP